MCTNTVSFSFGGPVHEVVGDYYDEGEGGVGRVL